MWIEARINKKHKRAVNVTKLGLEYGVIGYRPVIVAKRAGTYTRVYEAERPGVAIEVHDERDFFSLIINFPCGEADLRCFFEIIRKVMEKTGTLYFEVSEVRAAKEAIGELLEELVQRSRLAVAALNKEFSEGRKSFLVYGSIKPLVLNYSDFKRISNSLNKFTEVVNQKQSLPGIYVSPTIFSLNNSEREYGSYEIQLGKQHILPFDPDFLVSYEQKENFKWIVDLGWVALLYEDFINHVDTRKLYDEENFFITIQEEEAMALCRRFGYEPNSDRVTGKPYWGRLIASSGKHYRYLRAKGLAADRLSPYNHLAVILRWALEHDYLFAAFEHYEKELCSSLSYNIIDLREIIAVNPVFEGTLRAYMFKKELQPFLLEYISNGFGQQIDAYAQALLNTKAEEAYLLVPFDENYYAYLSHCLDQAWQEYQNA